MSGLDGWNRALDLVEVHLAARAAGSADDDLDAAVLARAALTSEHHFRRVFSALAGMPLSVYLRRRRITLATAEVLDGELLDDVAVRWGYGSADAFRRAFRALHGRAPEQARQPGAALRSQPRLTFHLTIEGSTDVQHRIETTPDLRLVGVTARLPLVFEGRNTAQEEFFRGLPGATTARIAALGDTAPAVAVPRGLLSATTGFEEGRADGSSYDHWHCAATTRTPAELAASDPDLAVLQVRGGLWAVFVGEGELPGALQQLWATAFAEWFPSNPYRLRPGPEVLSAEVSADGATGRGELWLPVERELGAR